MHQMTNGIRHEPIEFPKEPLFDMTSTQEQELNRNLNVALEFFGTYEARQEEREYFKQKMQNEIYELEKHEKAINKIIHDSYKQNILFHEDIGDTRWECKRRKKLKIMRSTCRYSKVSKNKRKIQYMEFCDQN